MRIVRLRISGRVQGVGYRDWAKHRALALGLHGWVRNRRDNSVEFLVAGDAASVQTLIDNCRRGPASARVDSIEIVEESEEPPRGFARRPTE